eukprot:NODE_551_length_6164_cov_0.432811.p8 type:complete len:167 gc:universal NODE_551_length_6164_cov_0.432811:2801-3301(+)
MDLLIMLYLTLCFSFPALQEAGNSVLFAPDDAATTITISDKDSRLPGTDIAETAADGAPSDANGTSVAGDEDARVNSNGPGDGISVASTQLDPIVGTGDADGERSDNDASLAGESVDGDAADNLAAVEPQALEDTPETGEVASSVSNPDNPDNPNLSTEQTSPVLE